MELNNIAKSGNKEGRDIDSDHHHIFDSAPKPSDAENIKYTKLDFKHVISSSFESKPSTSKITGDNSSFKIPSWSYNDSIPQFGPKKFQGKGLSSTITRPLDNGDNSSGSGYSLNKSVFGVSSELASVDEAIDPYRVQGDVEMQQILEELRKGDEDVLKNRSKTFTEVNKTTSPSKCLEDSEMEVNSQASILNEGDVYEYHSTSFFQVNKALSPSKIEMGQNSVNMISAENNALKSRFESIGEEKKVLSPSECLDDILIQKTSSEPMSSKVNVLKNFIYDVNKATLSSACSYELGVDKQLPNKAEVKKNVLRNYFGGWSEDGIANLTSECKKIGIHEANLVKTIATEANHDSGIRGMKRKRSGTDQYKVEVTQNAVIQCEEEDKIVRCSDINKATSPSVCSYELGVDKQLPNNAEVKAIFLRNCFGDCSEASTANLTSECKEIEIHEVNSVKTITTEANDDSGKRGIKRKHSGTDQDKAEITQNAVIQCEEEDKIVRRSQRIKNHTVRPLILDRPRRSDGKFYLEEKKGDC